MPPTPTPASVMRFEGAFAPKTDDGTIVGAAPAASMPPMKRLRVVSGVAFFFVFMVR